jgi:hypothetical protein
LRTTFETCSCDEHLFEVQIEIVDNQLEMNRSPVTMVITKR